MTSQEEKELAVRILDECADLYREPQHRAWAIERAAKLISRANRKPPDVYEQCPATYSTKSGVYFCVLNKGHDGQHKATHGRWKRASAGRQGDRK